MILKPHNIKYSTTIVVGEEDYENLDIEQNVEVTPSPIKFALFQERWRTPVETVELLKKTIEIIKTNFIK